jgi:hypothetical protein
LGRIGKILGENWDILGDGKTVAKKRQNVGIDKNIFIFFVLSPRPSLSISRGGIFLEKVSSKRPAFLFKEIGGEILRKEA